MARRKVFNTYRSSAEEREPIELVFNDSVFRFQPVLTGVQLLELLESFDSLELGEDAEMKDLLNSTGAITKILFDTVLAEDQDKFSVYINDYNNGITLEVLAEAAGFLLESYTGNPTESSSEQSDGSSTNGPGPTVAPSSTTASTSEPSPLLN